MFEKLKFMLHATLQNVENILNKDTYNWVEFSKTVFREKPPKMIRLDQVEAERAKTDNIDLFVSRFCFKENAPYFGPVISDFYMDFDCSQNPSLSLADAQRLAQYLKMAYDVNENEMAFYFTGSKGFCVELPFELFGAEPTEYLPVIWLYAAERFRDDAHLKHADFSVYEHRRMWRLVNSIHSATHKHKIMLQRGEIFHEGGLERIKELARQEQPVLPRMHVNRNGKLHDLYLNLKATAQEQFKSALARRLAHDDTEIPTTFDMSRVFYCVKKRIDEGIREGTFGREPTAMYIAASLRACGATREQALELVRKFASNCKPPLLDEREINHAMDSAYTDGYRASCITPCFADICKEDCRAKCFLFQGAELSEIERTEAVKYLENPKLLFNIKTSLGDIVGEEHNRLLLFLLELAKASIEVQGKSAAGKNTLVQAVLEALPSEWWEKVTGVTDKGLRYLGDNLRTLYLAERGALDSGGKETTAAYDVKLVISEGKLKILVPQKDEETGKIKSETIETTIENIISTTTELSIPDELENRLWVLSVDESEEQNERVRDFQLEQATKFKADRVNFSPSKAQIRRAVLVMDAEAPKECVIPFAKEFKPFLKAKQTRVRRDTRKLLALITQVARLHYRQRPILKDAEGVEHVVALPVDFWYAHRIASGAFLETVSGITKQLRNAYDAVKEIESPITSDKLAVTADISESRARRHLKALKDKGMIVQTGNKKPYEYILAERYGKSLETTSIDVPHEVSFSVCLDETESFLQEHGAQRALEDTLYDPLTCEPVLHAHDRTITGAAPNHDVPTEPDSNARAALRGTLNLDSYEYNSQEKKEDTD